MFLRVSKVLQIEHLGDCDFEAVWAKLFVADKSLAFRSSSYRPPGSGHKCLSVLHNIVALFACDTVVLGGDFNFPGL